MNAFSSIANVSQLSEKTLLDLLNGKILALRIYPFISQEVCINWQKKLEKSNLLNRYSNALDVPVNRIGMTLFETENDAEKLAVYLKESKKTLPLMELIFGRANPMKSIFEKLESIWESGISISKLQGQEMNPGIIRSFEAGKTGGLPAHVDSLLKDLPNTTSFNALQCQLAANLYFGIPEKGGELEIWDYAPNAAELEGLFSGNYDFIDTNKIPVKPQKFKPRLGELIIFRSNCIHSVKSSEGGIRSAASCFIGYYDDNKPLSIWS